MGDVLIISIIMFMQQDYLKSMSCLRSVTFDTLLSTVFYPWPCDVCNCENSLGQVHVGRW